MKHKDYIVLLKINEIIKTTKNIAINNMTMEEFLSDEKTKLATCMCAINLGEMVKILSPEFKILHPDVSWKNITGFRNWAAHRYGELDMQMVYISMTEDIKKLEKIVIKAINMYKKEM